ncbi:MAG: class I SAM-dependent methyltransferase, partial [Chloroflexi bacterium]|nr:class I SAM-dependent methyltransferase [Chloroflexota bacterium]
MSDEERATWDRRYREGGYLPRPSPFSLLEEWIDRLPRGRALDVACGGGRNALFLAAHGYEVDAVDGSPEALRLAEEQASTHELSVHWIEADLDDYAPPHGGYAVIVNCFYLNRTLLGRLVDALADDGYIFIEQHLRTPLPIPGNRDWRMEPNELLRTLS